MNVHLSSQQLTDLAEGLASPQELETLEAHLRDCARCREAFATRQAATGLLREGLPAYLEQVTPPPALRWESVRHRVPQNHHRERKWIMNMWRPLRAAAAGMALVAALAALVWGLSLLFREIATPAAPAATEPAPEEQIVEMSGQLPARTGGLFGGHRPVTVTVRAALPEVPEEVPLYRVEPLSEQLSPDILRQWAEWLEMGPVEVYAQEAPDGSAAAYKALNQAWDSLLLTSHGLIFSQGYLPYAWRMSAPRGADNDAIDEPAARAAAQAFLDPLAPQMFVLEGATEAPQVTVELEASQDLARLATDYYGYRFVPFLNGVSLEHEGGVDNNVVVGPDGQIIWAMITPVKATDTGERVRVRPPEDALADLLGGDAQGLRGSGWSSRNAEADVPAQIFYSESEYRKGQQINVIGGIEILRGLEGQPDVYLLQGINARDTFVLEGADLPQTVEAPYIHVWGTLLSAETPQTWRMAVTRWETAGTAGNPSWEGTVQRRDDGVWLQTPTGESLYLPDAPDGLPDGARVTVMGTVSAEAPDRVEWSVIAVLQDTSQVTAGAGVATEVVTQVEAGAAPAPPPPPAAGESEENAILEAAPAPVSAGAAESAVVVAQPAPGSEQTPPEWWPYRPGDKVTVEGLLYIGGYELPDGTVQIDAGVTVEGPAGDGQAMYLALGGEALRDLLPLNQLHVRVNGQIVGEEEAQASLTAEPVKAYFGQVLLVEAGEQLWPEEVKAVYSGPVRRENVDGEEVALLDDRLSGETYALPEDMVSWVFEETGPQEEVAISLIGVQEPGAEMAGYPALRVVQMSRGEGSVTHLQQELANPLRKITAEQVGPDAVLIDEVRLGLRIVQVYSQSGAPGDRETVEPRPELLYYLTGRSPDGRYEVTLRLEATELGD